MAIRSNLGTGVISVLVVDTPLFSPSSIERYHVVSANAYNNTSGNIILSVYISPDLTSSAGSLVEVITIKPGFNIDMTSIIGQGYNDDNIIVKATAIGLNSQLTRTEYTEES